MDPRGAERVALLSIKPEYAGAIFAGRKTVEFRRSRLAPDIELAIVYATQPLGRIIGWFQIGGIVESTPDGLWRRFRRNGAIGRRDYFAYFDGADRAYAIEIVATTPLTRPLLLDALAPGLRAPQSFQYLPMPLARSVMASHRAEDLRPPTLRPVFA